MPAPIARRTLAAPFVQEGVGVHTGRHLRLAARPAPFGTGIVFDVPGRFRLPATVAGAEAATGATRLHVPGATLVTVEHLLAALHGSGVTDAAVAVDGAELPFLDGSARPWLEAIAGVGTVEGPEATVCAPTRRLYAAAAGGEAWITPAEDAQVTVEVDFGPGGPQGRWSGPPSGPVFAAEVAPARTFALAEDIPRMLAAGRGKGASLDNTLVWHRGAPVNPGGVRLPDEPVRHKALDAIGDLALLGPWRGHVTVVRGSHALHHALLRAIVAAG